MRSGMRRAARRPTNSENSVNLVLLDLLDLLSSWPGRLLEVTTRSESQSLSKMMSSGNPRKFRHGIYLVYTWYILLAFVILVYTRYMTGICFLGKSIFVLVYHRMHVCMQWLLPKYTNHRALDGDLFSKSYIEFNISMVYHDDRHLLGIHLVYTTFVLVLILSE